MKLFAKAVSIIFSPILFLLIIPYYLVYIQTGSSSVALAWGIFSALFVVIGLVLIVIGRIKKVYSDLDLSHQEERARFYRYLWYLSFSYLLVTLFLNGVLALLAFGIVFATIALTYINKHIKASIHMAVVWGFFITVILIEKNLMSFLEGIIIIPLVAWSRLYLKRHTMREIVVGSLIGIGVTLLTFILWKILYNR